ncbi:hypothetical protein C8T65DRAFT_716548 [Cerioporus squamosus]|nr:hypothetical protein C8T65DRAFT_716548 [Cerioporus squamosus]
MHDHSQVHHGPWKLEVVSPVSLLHSISPGVFLLVLRVATRTNVVERSHTLGGWKADVLLESEPRTLRPNSKAVLELIHLLDLAPSVLTVSRSAPAARNRFLRFPVLHADSSEDESVDGFLMRHFGAEFVHMFGSALVHGIYAADSHLLSVRAAFPVLCQLEQSGDGGVVRGALTEMMSSMQKAELNKSQATEPYHLGKVANLVKDTLMDSMAMRLEEYPNVDLLPGDDVTRLRKVDGQFEVGIICPTSTTDSSSPHSETFAMPPLPHLLANPTSSAIVVNLVFPPSATPIHPDGFGYLIPRPSAEYPASSLGMLGTVFDSSALSEQDHYPGTAAEMGGNFTKLTVVLGGPYGNRSPAPSSPQFLSALMDTLQMHLGRRERLPPPCFVRVCEHRDCIPTPTVGYLLQADRD